MKFFITGGLGFVGKALSLSLRDGGHEVTVANRTVPEAGGAPGGIRVIRADTSARGVWQDDLGKHDAVINLAGATVFQRWTEKKKSEIFASRVETTKNVVDAIRNSGRKIDLFSASAVGYYGFHGDETIDETAGAGDDFLARVCVAWEQEALRAEEFGARVVLCRFGVVLGRNGGALSQLVSQFRMLMGGVIGSGRQWFSWIHMDDLVGIYRFLLDNPRIAGPVNFTAPSPVTNRELTAALSGALKRPVLRPPAPGFALRLLLGEFGDFLLKGQRTVPGKLAGEGYPFRYPDIASALESLVK